MAILNSSGKMRVFNTWLINKVSGLIIVGSIILINLEEIPHCFCTDYIYLYIGFFLLGNIYGHEVRLMVR